MTIYIAGPMTGLPDWNYPAFFEAEAELREQGFQVLNPASSGDPASFPERSWSDWIRLALGLLIQCDGVALLDGWEASRGASLEFHVATALGMPCRTLDAWLRETS